MKFIIAIIRPERLDAVKHELQKVEVNRLTVASVSGYGAQKGYLEVYRAFKHEVNLLEKIKLEIAVNDDFLQPTIEAIQKGAKSNEKGEIGDGKIFILPLEDVIRISTGEVGFTAI
ncbi:MAG: P-II family nitrogen regulator [Candidatus Methanomarinus sp.]|jgi:nitrogen regulatory protein P-II 1|uniref:P-II family nitrogen regulator n=1 Tax=Candidatus Methanomarinus sp. TaxID=3386244 RepID=A0AC61S8Z6_9EURY|nr:nitrogen regulatory protein P-II 1 [ANME-2 cluster archaeon]KAF5428008.1 MAG: nitrogen regulatory protein P-II 1 [ANME-2 cluster archaeon]PPA80142.1 MAG: putative nitrogen regulatory PII-like protein [ANME-2 cluster archaeon HR1]TKY91082.1 MAG: P-II family nitrogen regulator [ANME-2 cluster archaeon]